MIQLSSADPRNANILNACRRLKVHELADRIAIADFQPSRLAGVLSCPAARSPNEQNWMNMVVSPDALYDRCNHHMRMHDDRVVTNFDVGADHRE
jgi:hypothetical protein